MHMPGQPPIPGIPQPQAMVPYAQVKVLEDKIRAFEALIQNMPQPTEALQARMRSCEAATKASEARALAAESLCSSLQMEITALQTEVKEYRDIRDAALKKAEEESQAATHSARRCLDAERRLEAGTKEFQRRVDTMATLLEAQEEKLKSIPAVAESLGDFHPNPAPMDGITIDVPVEADGKEAGPTSGGAV